MRVKSVTFLRRSDGQETVVKAIASPLNPLTIKAGTGVNAVRIVFTQAFAQDTHVPTTAGLQDPDFKTHNVLVLVPQPKQGQLPYLPATLTIEAADTVRFDVISTPGVAANFPWPPSAYQLFLRGNDDSAHKRPSLADTADIALDGEPAAPSAATGNAISGDGTPGGDFMFPFTVA
jgi:hypothetical protein